MMDAQPTSYEHANIGSNNDCTLDHQLAAEPNDDHAQRPNNPQCGTAMNTPGNPQGTEYTTTRTCT